MASLTGHLVFLSDMIRRVEDYDRGYWMDGNMLGITGRDAPIWNHYISELEKAGIQLRDSDDTLVWDRGKCGSITAEEVYCSEIDELC